MILLHSRSASALRAALFAMLSLAFAAIVGTLSQEFTYRTGSVAVAASCRAWTMSQSPNVPTKINVLTSVSASSSNDIWAVGYYQDYGNDPTSARTLTMHWDGKAWTLVPSPSPNDGSNYLDGVAAVAPNNAWAVGDSGLSENPRTLLLHWDGNAWSPGKLPPLDADGSSLYAIKAVAANDIWAVGEAGSSQFSNGLILHYDGNDWLISQSTAFGHASILYGVNARSATDAWAVGAKVTDRGVLDLRMHWDGHTWEQVVEDDRELGLSLRQGLDVALIPDGPDAWIAGTTSSRPGTEPGVLHFDGGQWARDATDLRVLDQNFLTGIVATSKTDLWMVGYGTSNNQSQPLLAHSVDGTTWTAVTGAALQGNGALNDIAALPNGDYVAVGTANGATLIEFYSDPCAPAAATPTAVTAAATATSVGPNSTPSPTARQTYEPTPIPGDASRPFPETGKTVKGVFLDYWQKQGGLAQQGYPISEMFTEISALDRKPYTVQYFERAVFEYHPENQPPFNILLSQLGTFQYKKKYPSGASGQIPNTSPGSVLFSETGHRVGGRFLEYWQQNGGLAQQGFPISDEFQEKSDLDGKVYTVQYFERAVFERHPENQPPYDVLLSQLGTFRYRELYGK
jgi:hypothetical protein